MKEVKSIEFLNEIEGLENVSLSEVKGGLQLTSYAGGCSGQDHQAVQKSAATLLS